MKESSNTGTQPESFPMIGSLLGRLQRMRLSPPNAFQPVYEAISNSLYSISKARPITPKINIFIFRDKSQKEAFEDSRLAYPISEVTVQDNGSGFDKENFESFRTADGLMKVSEGGKGIGRLLWLKAFASVEVESVFRENGGGPRRRLFKFVANDRQPIQNHLCEEVDPSTDNLTKVKLIGFQRQYQDTFHHRPETIADKIIVRFLLHFLQNGCPSMTLHDGEEQIDLNARFREERVREIAVLPLEVKSCKLNALLTQLKPGGPRKHTLHLCAAACEVENFDLDKYLPYLPPHIPDTDGNPTRLAVYVTGDVLNDSVNEQRTTFNLPKEPDAFEPTLQEIIEGACNCVAEKYRELIGSEKQNAAERVRSFIVSKRPVYRPLLDSVEDHLPRLEKCKTDEELDIELNTIVREIEIESETEFSKYLDPAQKMGEDALKVCLMKISETSRVRLAQYVARRRAVLFVLKRLLETQADGRHAREANVHDLVFPMGKTSDEVPVDRWNLWLLDERLSFHEYLASDKSLKTQEPLNTDSGGEPDLLVLDRPGAFAEGLQHEYASIVIVEFKRPVREDVGSVELPHEQALRYIKKIQAGGEMDFRGRPINAARSRFYCYLVCDFTPKLRERLGDQDFIPTPDGLGFFKPSLNKMEGRFVYYEYISFDKLYKDAEKRNQALFHKLGIVTDPTIKE